MPTTTEVPGLPQDLWRRDETLRNAAALIERWDGKLQAVSFDFFDTIVWRMARQPIDVFNEVGRQLHQQGALSSTILPDDFEALRRHAEMKARERQHLLDSKREDISLSEIYRELQPVIHHPQAGAELEHALECKLCLLNPGMAEFIRYIRAKGLKVVVISDIYFTVEQLREILRANHFDPDIFEFILCSSQEGFRKGTGRLFKVALKRLGIKAGEMLHLGDNYHADVIGARRAGVRACHYPQSTLDLSTVLEREQMLLAGKVTTFNANSLRLLSARYFAQETDEGFFGRSGAMLMGPLMSRFASWACDQYIGAGIRKIGAFMREGDLFAQTLQNEADARNLDLEIKPLFINRKATDLAALGKLSATGLIGWLERRCTLQVRGILKHFGLGHADLKKLSLSLDEKADSQEKILKLAEFLFTPHIARRIEEKSAEERGKVMDYLKPWIDSTGRLGVCDLGYNASAQSQLHRILELEGSPVKVTGCYLVTFERAADRVLQGMDIRHFLGAYGKPDFNYRTFLRSPAFLEQSIVAPMGTTLGYERQADGTVKPVLDRMPFGPEMLRRQKAFKDGVLLFQKIWLACRVAKPSLLDAASEFSRRVLADIDASSQATLARATAFPLATELKHFGSLPLDDYYYADSMKTMCSEKDREQLRKKGYGSILGSADCYWPQGVQAAENPRANSEFFSYAKALIHCNIERDGDGSQVDLTIYVAATRSAALLRECLGRIASKNDPALRIELVVGVLAGDEELTRVASEFSRQFVRFRTGEISSREPANCYLNSAVDDSPAPHILLLTEETMLPHGWDKHLILPLREDAGIAAVLPHFAWLNGTTIQPSTRCVAMRRDAYVEGLGLDHELSHDGGLWKLLLHLRELKWKIATAPQAIVAIKAQVKNKAITSDDAVLLKNCWPDYLESIATLTGQTAMEKTAVPKIESNSHTPAQIRVDWIGSFLDYGSLSHVNRECFTVLGKDPAIKLSAVCQAPKGNVPAPFQKFAATLSKNPSAEAAVTIRHQWPPDWSCPKQGSLVIIQPWEFGALPLDWVKAAVNVDEFWVPSNYVRQVYINSGVPSAKVWVVPNGVDTNHFRLGIAPLKLSTRKKFKFLFVGGTIQRKGPDVLLKAYLEAFTATDDVCLVIKDFGGKSVYQGQTLEKEIIATQLKPNAPEILYLDDELPAEDMPRLYAACDCLVHPYRGEGFGLPVLEAMACGLPVVVTRGGSTDDFVCEGSGWFIASRRQSIGRNIGSIALAQDGWWLDPEVSDLVAKLKQVIADPDEARQRGAYGAKFAAEHCGWEKTVPLMKERLQALSIKSTPKTAPVKPITRIELPAAALLGHLNAAREALTQKRHLPAWELTLAALEQRSFHPEAWLLLSEIAVAAGDREKAKAAFERARTLAPNWKAVTQAAKNLRHVEGKLPIAFPEFPAIHPKPRLTVCLIVKNEEQFLERCLTSVRKLAHQIVVVDTGSTDRTVEIAKGYNAEIHSFQWNDDFSAARNEALKHATGDWILSLDADEELLPEHHAKILEEMQVPAVLGYRLPIVDVGREREGCSYVPRLFRNAPGLFFVGRVHEQIFSSLEVRAREWNLENTLGKSTLLHHGYVQEVVVSRDKIARNLRLLQIAIAEMPDEPNLLMNLGLELIRSGHLDGGLEKYAEALKLMEAMPSQNVVPELRETLLSQFGSHLLHAKRFPEVVNLFASKLAKDLTASQHFTLGLANLELKQPAQVAEQMRQCVAKRTKPALSPANPEIFKAGPNHCLALALMTLDNIVGANDAFEAALKDDPQSRPLRFDFAKFNAQKSCFVEALQILNGLVSENPADAPVWLFGGQIALSQPEFLEFANDWTQEALKHFSEHPAINLQRAEVLLLNQQVAEALPLFARFHAGQSPRYLAALVLCEQLAGECARTFSDNEEKIISQEFLKWYRQLLRYKATTVIQRVNDGIGSIQNVLPGVAEILSKALKLADAAVAA